MTSEFSLNQVLRTWVGVFMQRSFSDFKRFLDSAGLSPSQAHTLMRLNHCGPVAISDIADDLGLTVPAASQLVDRLVQQGYLTRAEHPGDRRFKQVTMTDKGRALVESGIEARQKWMEQLTTSFTPAEQQNLIVALTLLTEAARKMEGETASLDDRLDEGARRAPQPSSMP